MKTCNKCKRDKPHSEFAKNKHSKKDGLRGRCRTCTSEDVRESRARNKERISEREWLYRQMLGKEERWWRQVVRHFKLRKSEYYLMWCKQDGACAICTEPFTERPHIDHDHNCCPTVKTCGKCVRGLLCRGCNLAIGLLKDDVQTLRAATTYLEAFEVAA